MLRAPVRLPVTHLTRVATQTALSGGDCDCARLQIEDAQVKEEASRPRAVMSLKNFTGQLKAEWRHDSDLGNSKLTLTLCGKPRGCKQRRLFPERRQFKIRGTDRHVVWYKTTSHTPLKAPPAHLLRPQNQSLYVHAHWRGVQAWMFSQDAASARVDSDSSRGPENRNTNREREAERWRRTYEGQEHPDLRGYVLHFLQDGAPRWVRGVSAKAYDRKLRKLQGIKVRD